MLNRIKCGDDKVIVKIYDSDKKIKTTSKGGIITMNVLKPSMDSCQIGEIVGVGRNIFYIKEGDVILFNWNIENSDDYFLERDDDGEYRYASEKHIYGIIKTNKKTGVSHIQPKINYVIAEPADEDFALTKSIFQIPISGVNPQDKLIQKMGLKVGDWIIVNPYCAVPVTVKRKVFWFIHNEDILFINEGRHRISVNRKHVSQSLRLSSRNVKTNLN